MDNNSPQLFGFDTVQAHLDSLSNDDLVTEYVEFKLNGGVSDDALLAEMNRRRIGPYNMPNIMNCNAPEC